MAFNLTSRLVRAWRWMRATGCLAALALALATNAVAQQQPAQGLKLATPEPRATPAQDCYSVVTGGNAYAILLDRCTGRTWLLASSTSGGWRPLEFALPSLDNPAAYTPQ